MTGDPVTTTLLVSAATSAASAGLGIASSKKQSKLDQSQLKLQTEQARLAASDQALTQTRDFRQALASQLAISSLRGGSGGSLMRQFGATSMANFLDDQKSLQSKRRFIEASASSERSGILSRQLSRDINAVGGLLESSFQQVNFSNLNQKLKK